MPRQFFPDPVFAWVYCLTLFVLTCLATWVDTRTAKIPNRLTVLIFVLGLLAGAVRGGWMAAVQTPAAMWPWNFEVGSVWLGVLQGLLFGLTGFLVAFVVMFLAWMFAMCGGGDVKLVAAVTTWVGLFHFPLLWLVSGVVLLGWLILRLFAGGISPKQVQKKLASRRKDHAADQAARAAGKPLAPAKPGKVRVTYSLPVAVATIVVLLWVHRVELGLAQPKPQPQPDQQSGALAHARPTPRLA